MIDDRRDDTKREPTPESVAEYDIRVTVKRVSTNEAHDWVPDAIEVAGELDEFVRDREVGGWWFAGAVPL